MVVICNDYTTIMVRLNYRLGRIRATSLFTVGYILFLQFRTFHITSYNGGCDI